MEGGPAGTGDRHVLVLDRDAWKPYELFDAHPVDGGRRWRAGSGAVSGLRTGDVRPAGWTSAEAIRHALRFTRPVTRRGYVHPARHFASTRTEPSLPPMGMRVRLRGGFDVAGFPPSVRPVLEAMKRHGMLLADNGSAWYVSGAPDPRWNDDELAALRRVRAATSR